MTKNKPQRQIVSPKVRFSIVCFLAVIAFMFVVLERIRLSKLEESSSVWAEAITAMRDTHTGIVIVRVGETTVDKANEEAEDLFGYSHGAMQGLPVSELIPPEYLPQHTAAYNKRMKDATDKSLFNVIPVACVGKRKDGGEVPCVIRLYIGHRGILALINSNKESKYIPMDKMGRVIEPANKTESK